MRLQLYMVPVTDLDQLQSPFVSRVFHNVFPRGGYSQNNWMEVCSLFTKTTTLFNTKICDFPYPIYELTKIQYPVSDVLFN